MATTGAWALVHSLTRAMTAALPRGRASARSPRAYQRMIAIQFCDEAQAKQKKAVDERYDTAL